MTLTKTNRLKALLEKGYFPQELPPPFNTVNFAKYRTAIDNKWKLSPNKYPKTTQETYSYPRINKARRNLSLVNPIAQFYISKLISENWIEIRHFLEKSKYSLQIPIIEFGRKRAVPPPDFSFVNFRKAEISSIFDHVCVSDISRFYGTLYTHAIPWALHGKAWCKENLNKNLYKSSLGAKIDQAVRKGQDNQTIGIPIGPDTSRIISEIIGVAIDINLQNNLKLDKTRAFRNIDDWYIGFNGVGDAEDAVSSLAMSLRDFELEINIDKTTQYHAPSSVESIWPSELREFRFEKRGRGSSIDSIEHFFVKAFTYAIQFQNENVLDFAVKKTMALIVNKSDWRIYETYLLKAARSNPTVLPAVVEILVSYNFYGYKIDFPRIRKLIADIIERSAPLSHHAEVAWCLFLAKGLRIKIPEKTIREICHLESSVVALLALDLQSLGLTENPLDTTLWLQSMNSAGLKSSMWLLAYESDLKGWLSGKVNNFVEKDTYFSFLKEKNISFYDEKKNVSHIRRKQKARPSKNINSYLSSILSKIVSSEGRLNYYD